MTMDERRTLWIHLTAGGVALACLALLDVLIDHKSALAWVFMGTVLVITVYSLVRDGVRLMRGRFGV